MIVPIAEQAASSRLDAALEATLSAHFGMPLRIRGADCHPSSYRSSFFVDELDVRLDDGASIELVAKAIEWDAMVPEARLAKPPFLWDAERERATYEAVLPFLQVHAPRYFGSYVGDAGVRYLLLERIAGVPLWQCGDFEVWREAARALARMHAATDVARVSASPAADHLIRYDRRFYAAWMQRASAFVGGGVMELRPIEEAYRHVIACLLAEDVTFIHGEFYSSNILVEGEDAGCTVRPIDWEMAALGPALMDVACLMAGRWTDEERADVADGYYATLAEHGRPVPPRERYLKTLDCCLIHLCVRNLGWSRDWSPPSDRRHDWLGEALRLCARWSL